MSDQDHKLPPLSRGPPSGESSSYISRIKNFNLHSKRKRQPTKWVLFNQKLSNSPWSKIPLLIESRVQPSPIASKKSMKIPILLSM